MIDVACPSCGVFDNICIGEVPQMQIFAGKIMPMDLTRANLYKCKVCNLYFKWPHLEKVDLNKLYEAGDPENWHSNIKNRMDWQLAVHWIKTNLAEGSILDIGCWDGTFLENLKETLDPYGIEINPTTADKAALKGITIVGNDMNKIGWLSNEFDVTTSFDVIEHVENPFEFLKSMCESTKKDGIIIISSGDTDIFPWKISGPRYLYCANPEHISFINSGWCSYAARALNLRIELLRKFPHASKFKLYKIVFDSIKNIIYLIAPSFLATLRKIKHSEMHKTNEVSTASYIYPPPWTWVHDHLIVAFRKIS